MVLLHDWKLPPVPRGQLFVAPRVFSAPVDLVSEVKVAILCCSLSELSTQKCFEDKTTSSHRFFSPHVSAWETWLVEGSSVCCSFISCRTIAPTGDRLQATRCGAWTLKKKSPYSYTSLGFCLDYLDDPDKYADTSFHWLAGHFSILGKSVEI